MIQPLLVDMVELARLELIKVVDNIIVAVVAMDMTNIVIVIAGLYKVVVVAIVLGRYINMELED